MLAGTVVLLIPVVGEDPAVDVVQLGTATFKGLKDVLQLVEPSVRTIHPGHQVTGVLLSGLDVRPLIRGEHPSRRVLGDRLPHTLRGAGQFGVRHDFEFTVVSHCCGPFLLISPRRHVRLEGS
ncbi:hypothetical protein D3C73_1419350 [compost metagenome]